ncbi:MAG: hypothetical protein SPI30_08805 [Prevotella sp.]|nr:hypothetical protein [Prevotella sp.]
MAITARGQITIVDLNDAAHLTTYLEASKGDAQMYNPDTRVYTPNYGATPNVITPKIFLSGVGDVTARCKLFKYTVDGTAYTTANTTGNLTVSADGKLSVKQNIAATVSFMNILFECTYVDPDTSVETIIQAQKTITRNESAGAILQALIEMPSGYIFDQSHTAALTAKVKAFRGGTEDTSAISYKWEKLVGTTWQQVSAAQVLTVQPSDVVNFQTYRATVTSTDTAQPGSAMAYVTFEDKTDPYELEILSTKGLILKKGEADTVLQVSVWQAGAKIEDHATAASSQKFIYTWTKYDKNGVPSNFSGTTSPNKTGNPLTIVAADIAMKAIFVCEITKK